MDPIQIKSETNDPISNAPQISENENIWQNTMKEISSQFNKKRNNDMQKH